MIGHALSPQCPSDQRHFSHLFESPTSPTISTAGLSPTISTADLCTVYRIKAAQETKILIAPKIHILSLNNNVAETPQSWKAKESKLFSVSV